MWSLAGLVFVLPISLSSALFASGARIMGTVGREASTGGAGTVNRRTAWPAVLISTALTLLGCAQADNRSQQSTTVEVSYDDLLNQKHVTRQVSLIAGDTLRVVLASNASTGYQWTAQAQISDSGVLSQTSHQTVAPTDAKPGAAGTEVWTFDALKPGSATVTTSYGQPWPGGTKNAWTFSAAVTVR